MDYPVRLVDQLRAHLQALRRQRGLTQAQLGQRLGLSQVRIAEIEARPGLVSVDQLVRILSALGVGLVLRDEDTEAAPAAPRSASESPKATARRDRQPARAVAPNVRTAGASAKTPSPRAKTASSTAVSAIKPKKGSW